MSAEAQRTQLSPYSRFGIGQPYDGSYTSQFGIAGGGVALIDGLHVNPFNPAANTFLAQPSFEFGVRGTRLETSDGTNTVNNSTNGFNHFVVGFPMWNGKWGASFGLRPYSTIGYETRVEQFDETIDEEYGAEYIGSGGLNSLHLDIGRKLRFAKDSSDNAYIVSFGAGMDYLFGSIRSERNTIFAPNTGFFNTRIEDATTISDIVPKAGILLRYLASEGRDDEGVRKPSYLALNLGASMTLNENVSAERSRDAFSFLQNASGIDFQRDSILSFEGRKGRLVLPIRTRIGASIERVIEPEGDKGKKLRKMILSFDLQVSDWATAGENFTEEIQYDNLGMSSLMSIGYSYVPNVKSKNAFEKGTYRLGYRFGDSHLSFDNEPIKESGMSFGMSLPLHTSGTTGSKTQLDLGIAYSERGTTDMGLIAESQVHYMIGISFHPTYYDRWFVKSKYD